MGCDGTVRSRVGEAIERLEERYGSFPINQTTLTVGEGDYETASERADAGAIDVYVRVSDDDGNVLHLDDDGEGAVPRCVNDPTEPLGLTVARTLREEADVVCAVDGVARVTIAGVNSEAAPDAPTVYRLVALLDAEYERGPVNGAVWESGEAAIPEYV